MVRELGERARALKAVVRELFRQRVAQWLWVRPIDLWLSWSLPVPADDDLPSVDIFRVGTCEDRVMPDHHHNGPIGYTRYMIEVLAEQGIRTGYQNLWAWFFDNLPQTEKQLLKRRRMNRPAPDLVLMQLGPIYTGKHVLGGHRRIIGMRENFSKRMGKLIFPIWRVVAKALRIWGQPTLPYPGSEQLDTFIDLVLTTWPNTVVAIYEPMNPSLEGGLDRQKWEHLCVELKAAAERHGDRCRFIDRPDLGTDMRLRISNGYNLNEAGSRIIGRHLAEWITAQPDLVRRPVADAGAITLDASTSVGKAV